MSRRLLLFSAGLAIVIFLFQVSRMMSRDPVSANTVVRQGTIELPVNTPTETTAPLAIKRISSSGITEIDQDTSDLRSLLVANQPYPHELQMDLYADLVWAEVASEAPELASRDDPAVGGDLAFRLYVYYRTCSGAPRTRGQADFRLQFLGEKIENRSSLKHLESLGQRADQQFDLYQLCLPISAETEVLYEAVKWFGYAVERGHEVAQVQYYYLALETLINYRRGSNTPSLVMIHPELIEEYKRTARYGLQASLRRGHPESYLAMSLALRDGIIYPRDPVTAYAYAVATELKSGRGGTYQGEIRSLKYQAAQLLTDKQVSAAKKMAQQLTSGN